MPEQITHNQDLYRLRAKLPQYFRIAAVGVIAVTILAVVIGFYRERSKSPFKLKSEHTRLSTDVVADVNGYERLETDGGVSKFYIKADSAKTFSDEHQELQNVYVETFDNEGLSNNKMTAESALYVPEADKNFTAYLKGNVQIETPDALKIKTNNIIYTKKNETAEADEAVEFERANIRGKSFGASVKIGDKIIELLKNVEIEAFESPELVRSNIRYAKINTNSAVFDQLGNRIDLRDNVAINIESKGKSSGKPQMTDVLAERASVFLNGSDPRSSQLKRFEFFDKVHIVSSESGTASTNIDCGYASYDRYADRFELKNGTHIVMSPNDKPTDITSSEAIYEQSAGKLTLTGNAVITQGSDYLKGELLHANLFPDKKVKDAVIRGNASARQTTTERTTLIAAPEMNAAFGESRQLHDANAIGQSDVEIIPNENKEYSKVSISAASGIGLLFKGPGMIDALRTDGRTSIQLSAPDAPDAANKRVSADVVRTTFGANGKDISKAEAVGNAELNVEPLHNDRKNYKTTINAPRFDCEFFPTGNNAKTCTGGRKTKTVRVPTIPEQTHGTQTLVADQITANFDPQSKDFEQLNASGNARFTELDNNAIAAEMTFTQADETLRLRGGEPTGWNSKYRSKAKEIDWNIRSQHSFMRGKVSTTYYSLKQLNNAAPFGQSDKPVFITSDSAEFDQPGETAIYLGNARAWQENNYIHGDKFTLKQKDGQFLADGNVRSAAYNVKVNQKTGNASVPVFASASTMTYGRDSQLLQYRTHVDIRQGTDRITANSADVYLNKENEVTKTIAETNVVVSQPGRRGTGDWLQYTSSDEMAILRGSPALVEDAENGSSQAAQLTLYMREKRVVSEGKSKQPTSTRMKSVYKVQGKQ
ncbi:MAG: LPS export ABC transporter periplasmic protein LptC [Chloracidobacterium sp.]|nr:LPS export ABC transporter periplasmic protein LptC [Chloracidobacterium sp.]